mmetsp:Transcript_6131/g.23177  ORF Transcript_6131/g.23177 Transcript_6131/m.23177 type:complete len:234 (+) Transcript_6131:556-1257(+)
MGSPSKIHFPFSVQCISWFSTASPIHVENGPKSMRVDACIDFIVKISFRQNHVIFQSKSSLFSSSFVSVSFGSSRLIFSIFSAICCNFSSSSSPASSSCCIFSSMVLMPSSSNWKLLNMLSGCDFIYSARVWSSSGEMSQNLSNALSMPSRIAASKNNLMRSSLMSDSCMKSSTEKFSNAPLSACFTRFSLSCFMPLFMVIPIIPTKAFESRDPRSLSTMATAILSFILSCFT